MENRIFIEELTKENVELLTEEQAAEVISEIGIEQDKDKRSRLMKIVETAFKLRTISARNRNLKADQAFFGYKFFPAVENNVYARVIRRKTNKK
jgi:hypothetical protein